MLFLVPSFDLGRNHSILKDCLDLREGIKEWLLLPKVLFVRRLLAARLFLNSVSSLERREL